MKFKDKLINNIIEPSQSVKLNTALGKVIKFDKENNTANILIKNIAGKQNYTLHNVPIQLSGVGVHSSPLSCGSKVYVQFNNNSIFQAKIIGFADENYKINTREKERHTRKGSFIVNQEYIEDDTLPSMDRWLDLHCDVTKYSDFRYRSPIEDIMNRRDCEGFFNNNEVGLFNPTSSAIVKIKDNGTIDIFTATNVGIRVNPNSKTIEMFGDTTTKSKNWSVLSNNVSINANDKLYINANDIEVEAKKITVNGGVIC